MAQGVDDVAQAALGDFHDMGFAVVVVQVVAQVAVAQAQPGKAQHGDIDVALQVGRVEARAGGAGGHGLQARHQAGVACR